VTGDDGDLASRNIKEFGQQLDDGLIGPAGLGWGGYRQLQGFPVAANYSVGLRAGLHMKVDNDATIGDGDQALGCRRG